MVRACQNVPSPSCSTNPPTAAYTPRLRKARGNCCHRCGSLDHLKNNCPLQQPRGQSPSTNAPPLSVPCAKMGSIGLKIAALAVLWTVNLRSRETTRGGRTHVPCRNKQMRSTASGKPACPSNLRKCRTGLGRQPASNSGDHLGSFSPYRGMGTYWQ